MGDQPSASSASAFPQHASAPGVRLSFPITVHIAHCVVQTGDPDFQQKVLNHFSALNAQGDRMARTIDELLQNVKDERTVEDSLVQLTTNIKASLDKALANTTVPPDVQAKIDQAFDLIEQNKTVAADAITANTPAVTPPAP